MRRFDVERNDTGGGRGFRIIEAGGRYLEPLTPPPPPRAPEPYKVASSSSVLGRAHRRSSFVIIAETRPTTPSSRSPSPSLPPTGRVSPFRGRGFKGPLPHAQSRPQTPDDPRRIPYGRYDRRASVSQQNSPKRSLIPQPTRRRSSSLTKSNVTRTSPKFGRRALQIPRNIANSRPSVNNSNVTRGPSFRGPELSPIQGTPTKPYDGSVVRIRPARSLVSKVSPLKTRGSLAVPRLNGDSRRAPSQARSPGKMTAKRPEPRRFVEEKKSSPEDDSKTRIPMRRGSLVGKNGPDLSTNRFVGKHPTRPLARAVKPGSDDTEEESTAAEDPPGIGENVGENSARLSSSGKRFVDSPIDTKRRENDLGLLDLLKQSSGAMGTSSVVNTTTTTAVQPLQIDATAVLLEKDREIAAKRRTTSASPGSGNSPPITGPTSTVASENVAAKVSKGTSRSDATNETRRAESRGKEVAGSAATTHSVNGTGQKNPSRMNNDEAKKTTTTTKNATTKEQSNAANNGQTPREKQLVGATGSSRKNLHAGRNVSQDGSREARVTSANTGSRNVISNGGAVNDLSKSYVKDETGSGKDEASLVAVGAVNSVSAKVATAGSVVVAAGVGAVNKKFDSRGNVPSRDDNERTLLRNVGADKDAKTSETREKVGGDGGGDGGGDDNQKSRRTNGSDKSLKSLNGLSNVSAESARSTDTGVSLDTVRGVSSAREKKGLHAVKRSEEIETLSGNVVHLERNGEAAVLDIAEAPEVPEDRTRLGRLKESLARFGDRLPSMRCLGCRRGQKPRTWMEERRGPSVETRRNGESTGEPAANGNSRFGRIWTSWKNACRCTRLRECKCCRRATRIAPAESTSCCPPERRCGAVCGRLFSCCKCERAEAQHTRSIRAKHSLTSIAPPPLSEEPKAKIPEVLVEHNSVMRGAIPCLPVPIAWFCLVWNVLLPGSGTVWSGLFNLCIGQPRFSISAGPRARLGALVVNVIVGVSQFFTVLFCLVGWGWSIWWGVTLIRLARKYKRYRASEAASNDLEARAGEQTGLPAGVPSQALRGMERAR